MIPPKPKLVQKERVYIKQGKGKLILPKKEKGKNDPWRSWGIALECGKQPEQTPRIFTIKKGCKKINDNTSFRTGTARNRNNNNEPFI